ncbi:hypothetical protein BKA63DRAFT_570480 [Paraphoma chrysanthemicola]|nr:hypothetical protein BKA63DRAFT_570480 [Paraphoma chrysanthemicola]
MGKLQRELKALSIPASSINLQRSDRKARRTARTAATAGRQKDPAVTDKDDDTKEEQEKEQHEDKTRQHQQSDVAPLILASSDSASVHDVDAADFDSNRRECIVCLEVCPISDFPHLKDCKQESTTCRTCFANWLSNEVGNTASLSQVRCPCESQDCKVPFTWEDAREYATPEVFARFDHLHVLETLRKDPNFRYCIVRDCSFGQIHGDNDGNIFICGSCGHRHCTRHNITFHDGETCEQYDERERLGRLPHAEQELASKAALEKISTQCPGPECGYWVQKSSRCDHMTCTRCGFQFCYLCSAPYQGVGGIDSVGNAAHGHQCPHHTNNIMDAHRDSTDGDDRVDSSAKEGPRHGTGPLKRKAPSSSLRQDRPNKKPDIAPRLALFPRRPPPRRPPPRRSIGMQASNNILRDDHDDDHDKEEEKK